MILKNNKANKDRGFTIVELLVVIVVIGILAAITIVSYTGITARANTSATKQMASNVIAKAGIYQTESTAANWPLTGGGALGAMSATNSSAAITGVTVNNGVLTAGLGNTALMTTISYQLCGSTMTTGGTSGSPSAAPGSLALTTNPTGVTVGYWDYVKTPSPGESTLSAGQTSGSVNTGGTNYNSIACFYTAT